MTTNNRTRKATLVLAATVLGMLAAPTLGTTASGANDDTVFDNIAEMGGRRAESSVAPGGLVDAFTELSNAYIEATGIAFVDPLDGPTVECTGAGCSGGENCGACHVDACHCAGLLCSCTPGECQATANRCHDPNCWLPWDCNYLKWECTAPSCIELIENRVSDPDLNEELLATALGALGPGEVAPYLDQHIAPILAEHSAVKRQVWVDLGHFHAIDAGMFEIAGAQALGEPHGAITANAVQRVLAYEAWAAGEGYDVARSVAEYETRRAAAEGNV